MSTGIGLSSQEASRRLRDLGPNEVVSSHLGSVFNEALKVLSDPMGLMLLLLAGLYWIIGSRTDAWVLLAAYVPVTGVDVLLHLRAERALKAMKSHMALFVKVIRDDRVQEVPLSNIVVGDVVVFEEGQCLPADGKIIESDNLLINEATLTGESLPVDKTIGSPFFGGTIPLQGRGLGLVEKTGKQTRFGKISTLVEKTENQETPLQRKVNHLIRRFFWIALFLAVILFGIEFLRGSGWAHSLIVAVTFGMAAVPEEFPIVYTLYLSLGAWRLSRHGVLVKSLPSVEVLGSVDVICTDKTGTLTEGQFQLESIIPIGDTSNEVLWKAALMACEIQVVDSMEAAIAEKGRIYRPLLEGWILKYDYPFEPLGKHMSHVWTELNGKQLIAMKGAVEGVLEHCSVSAAERSLILETTHQLAQAGKRLLGLAYREGSFNGERLNDERDLKFLGILVFSDPTRASARLAVLECQKAGIEIKMLTGDHPGTAHAVADEIGMAHDHQLLFTGEELTKLKAEERENAFLRGAIFSRVLPEQKYEMVRALKAHGNIVAMTGDGINDAPALKLADIGISMGAAATDAARASSRMVLLKNDFTGIVEAVFEGRKIFANLKRSFSYLISFHIPIVFLAFAPPLFGWGDLLLPVHIVLLELIVHPVSAFGFENLPHSKHKSTVQFLLTKRNSFEAILSGVLLSVFALIAFGLVHTKDLSLARTEALTITLFGVVTFLITESWNAISRRVVLISATLFVFTILLVRIQSLCNVFHLTQISFEQLAWSFLIGAGASVPTVVLRSISKSK